MERTSMRDSLFNMEKEEWIHFCGGGGSAQILGVWVQGSLKNRSKFKGEDVKFGYKTRDPNPWARLGLFAEILAP